MHSSPPALTAWQYVCVGCVWVGEYGVGVYEGVVDGNPAPSLNLLLALMRSLDK